VKEITSISIQPPHSYVMLYKYPQAESPYEYLVEENRRSRNSRN
jgi:hypothetical protein